MSKTTVLRSQVGVTLKKVELSGGLGPATLSVSYSVVSARLPTPIYQGEDLSAAEKAFADEVHKVRNA